MAFWHTVYRVSSWSMPPCFHSPKLARINDLWLFFFFYFHIYHQFIHVIQFICDLVQKMIRTIFWRVRKKNVQSNVKRKKNIPFFLLKIYIYRFNTVIVVTVQATKRNGTNSFWLFWCSLMRKFQVIGKNHGKNSLCILININ